MGEKHTFEVMIKPDGVPLTDDTKTHTHEFSTESVDPDTLWKEATKEIITNHSIDSVSFRKYWEIVRIEKIDSDNENTASLKNLKDKLETLGSNPPNTFDAYRIQQNPQPHPINYYDDGQKNWSEAFLFLSTKQIKDFEKWIDWLQYRYQSLNQANLKTIHEAIIRTVAETNYASRITNHLLDKPDAHEMFINAAMQNEDRVIYHAVNTVP